MKIGFTLSIRAITGAMLFVVSGIALALRVFLPYEFVFVGNWVRFGGKDPWYHIRLVENLVQHFPHRIDFDPFALYPYGHDVPFAPFFDLLLGFFIWVIGLGSPTQHTIETVGAYFPAILGALVTIPVYFIGRELFNRTVGLLAAALIAVLPGQYFFRSMLGYTDHHIAEVLFSTTAALLLILAIKRARENEISFSHIWSRNWGNLKKPLIYAVLAGLALGIYLDTWRGGLLFVFIVFAYVVIQYTLEHLRGKSTDYLCIIGVPMFLTALLLVIPFLRSLILGDLIVASLTIGMLTPIALSAISRLMAYRDMRRLYYPMAIIVLGVVGIALLYVIDPSLYHTMVDRFQQVFAPSERAQAIGEAQSMLSISGVSTLFRYFTVSIVLALVAFGLTIYTEIKNRRFESTLTFLIIWSLIVLLAMLGQNRFAYYFAVNVALLSGYLCWKILDWTWGYFVKAPLDSSSNKGMKGAEQNRGKRVSIGGHISAGHVSVAVVAIILLLGVFLPNIWEVRTVSKNSYGPNEAWHSALVWMSDTDNTQDPFEDPEFYYELYDRPPAGEKYAHPESAYGVMAWYHRGFWITEIAHRIPNANPFGSGTWGAAQYFLAQDESSANEALDNLGSKYVIIDLDLVLLEYEAVAIKAGKSELQFREIYYERTREGELKPKLLYYPDYYQSMCARLYNFNGEAVIPHNATTVISYDEATLRGELRK
jgi:oligosaccharyl transferase (archaeosortase A-associated)